MGLKVFTIENMGLTQLSQGQLYQAHTKLLQFPTAAGGQSLNRLVLGANEKICKGEIEPTRTRSDRLTFALKTLTAMDFVWRYYPFGILPLDMEFNVVPMVKYTMKYVILKKCNKLVGDSDNDGVCIKVVCGGWWAPGSGSLVFKGEARTTAMVVAQNIGYDQLKEKIVSKFDVDMVLYDIELIYLPPSMGRATPIRVRDNDDLKAYTFYNTESGARAWSITLHTMFWPQ